MTTEPMDPKLARALAEMKYLAEERQRQYDAEQLEALAKLSTPSPAKSAVKTLEKSASPAPEQDHP